MRKALAAALVVSMTGCASMTAMFQPPGHPWPSPDDERVTRSRGNLLAVGSSVRDPIEAEEQARGVLQKYLQRLEIKAAAGEKATLIRAALRRADVVNGRGDGGTYTATLVIPLRDLQQLLGTDYD